MKREFLIGPLFVILLSGCAGQPAVEYYRRAQQQYYSNLDSGRFDESVKFAELAVATEPDNLTYREFLALALTASHRYDEAIAEYRHILEKDRARFGARINLGIIYEGNGLLERALFEHLRATDELPKSKQLLVDEFAIIARLYGKKGMYEEAKDYLSKAIEMSPAYGYAHFLSGQISLLTSDYEKAFGECQKAVALMPGYHYANDCLGTALLRLKKYEEALDQFDLALKCHQEYTNALYNRFLALKSLGRVEEAKKALKAECVIVFGGTPCENEEFLSRYGGLGFTVEPREAPFQPAPPPPHPPTPPAPTKDREGR